MNGSSGIVTLSPYTPSEETMPAGRTALRQFSNVSWMPSASIATSAPRPSVSALTFAIGSSWV